MSVTSPITQERGDATSPLTLTNKDDDSTLTELTSTVLQSPSKQQIINSQASRLGVTPKHSNMSSNNLASHEINSSSYSNPPSNNLSSPTLNAPLPTKEEVLISKWRKQFNIECFGTHLESDSVRLRGPSDSLNKSKKYSRQDIADIIFILEKFSSGDLDKMEFKKENRNGYNLQRKFYVKERMTVSDSNEKIKEKVLLKFDSGKGNIDRLVCAAEEVFDAIYDSHTKIGHLKTAKTHHKVSETYCNITAEQVKKFIDLCPICAQVTDNNKKKKKGPGIAIKSVGFRDRVQVDLVDYTSDQRLNHLGVKMRYLMVIKDHFTKFVWLRAIPKKEAIFVATELRILFHEIGFPLIFHTDNGTEFINKTVYGLLKDADPGILLVSGASRTPRHQGSVENSNQHIKKIIQKETETLKMKIPTKDVGWVDVLPQATSAMNATVGYGQGSLTPYRHVYSQDYEFPLAIPCAQMNTIRTITALDEFVNDDVLSEKLSVIREEISESDENMPRVPTESEQQINKIETPHEHDEATSQHTRTSTSSNDIIPTVTTEKSELQDQNSETPHPLDDQKSQVTKISTICNETKPVVTATDQSQLKICKKEKIQQEETVSQPSPKRKKRKHVHSARDVLACDPNDRILSNAPQMKFSFVLGHLSEELATAAARLIIGKSVTFSIGDGNYYKYCWENSTRYWELDFITTFSTLQTLSSKRSDICFVDNLVQNFSHSNIMPDTYTPPKMDSTKTKFVTVVFRDAHFATILLDTKSKKITIYDGLYKNKAEKVLMWKDHVKGMIHRIFGVGRRFKIVCATKLGDYSFVQHDGYNCGPIACVTIWILLSTDDERKSFRSVYKLRSFEDPDLRKIVVKEMESKLDQYREGIKAMSRYEEVINDENESQKPYDEDIYLKETETEEIKSNHSSPKMEEKFAEIKSKTVPEIKPNFSTQKKKVGMTLEDAIAIAEKAKRINRDQKDNADSKSDDMACHAIKIGIRKQNNATRTQTQQKQAQTLLRQRHAAISITAGDIVSITVPKKDKSNWMSRNLIGIVLVVKNGMGINVVTEYGIIYQNLHMGKSQKPFNVPTDMYEVVRNQQIPISDELTKIKESIESKTFIESEFPRISMRQAHDYACDIKGNSNNTSDMNKSGCRCNRKTNCGQRCGCRRRGVKCTSSCACKGLCVHNTSETNSPPNSNRNDTNSDETMEGTKSNDNSLLLALENVHRVVAKVNDGNKRDKTNDTSTIPNTVKSPVNKRDFIDLNPANHVTTPPIPRNIMTDETIVSGITQPNFRFQL